MRKIALMMVALALPCLALAQAKPEEATSPQDLRDFIPPTISPEARALFEKLLPLVDARRKEYTTPKTLADFDANYAKILARAEANTAPLLKKLGVTNAELHMGGVGVYVTKPPNYTDDGTVLIRVHGGGFIQDSARSSAGGDALMATATGKRILSVDYTVAPRAARHRSGYCRIQSGARRGISAAQHRNVWRFCGREHRAGQYSEAPRQWHANARRSRVALPMRRSQFEWRY